MNQSRQRALLTVVAFGFGACVGSVEPTGDAPPKPGQPGAPNTMMPGQPGAPAPGTPDPNAQPPAPPEVSAGTAPLRRLNAEQYRNTVRDLLGLQDGLAALALPADDAIDDRFLSNGASAVKSIDLDRYGDAAEGLAKRAVANLAGLVPCDPKAGDAGCAKRFIESFGRRAYRRPLRAEEVTRLEKVYAAGGDFTGGIELVIVAMLQSPKFLYLVEPVPAGQPGSIVRLDGYATASRLSYFLLGTMPDEALLAAADKGELASASQVAAQVRRLTADPRFRANVGSFHQQWLLLHQIGGADKDLKLFPSWTPELRSALAEESRRFVEHVMANEEGKIEALLGASYSILNGPLYDYYGVPRPAGAADWAKAPLNPAERAGILTHGSLLAAQAHADKTSYILRGKLIREALFCSPVPPPPPEANTTEPNLPPSATAKERAQAHRENPSCATCHELFDPIGFAFENYDAAGRYRKTEAGGQAIDATATITQTKGLDGPVANGIELVKKIAAAPEVRDCVARQWLRFALGRDDGKHDERSLDVVRNAFRAGGKLPDLMVALAEADSFRYQRLPE